MKNKYLFIALIIVLAACKGQTTYIKQVVNNSSRDIFVSGDYYFFDFKDSSVVAAHSTKNIFEQSDNKSRKELGSCFDFVNSLTARATNGDTLLKDINNENNWSGVVNTVHKNPKYYEHVCTITIEDSDFK